MTGYVIANYLSNIEQDPGMPNWLADLVAIIIIIITISLLTIFSLYNHDYHR